MTTDEKIAVLQASKVGKQLQIRSRSISGTRYDEWQDSGVSEFNFVHYDYRVKPEPQEFWINVFWGGPGRVHSSERDAVAGRQGAIAFVKTVHVREVL